MFIKHSKYRSCFVMNSFGKIRYVLTILFLFITINQYLYTDDTSIAILPMKYTQDSKHLKAMSTAIPDIISLNLKFIEGYNVKSINETDFNTKNLQKICDSNKIELLIY